MTRIEREKQFFIQKIFTIDLFLSIQYLSILFRCINWVPVHVQNCNIFNEKSKIDRLIPLFNRVKNLLIKSNFFQNAGTIFYHRWRIIWG